jgi:hypothetical protein
MIDKVFVWKSFQLQQHIKHWAKPTYPITCLGALYDPFLSSSDLVLENLLLRRPLIVLNHQVKQTERTSRHRFHLILLSRYSRPHILQPKILLL